MDWGTISKLVFFLIWPVILLLLYYLLDRKGFIKRMENVKKYLDK